MNPIDLLPVCRPYDDPNPPNDSFFYYNVILKILPNIIQMEKTGIPINLAKVKEIEEITNTILNTVERELADNTIIQEFIESLHEQAYPLEYQHKLRTKDNYKEEFKRSNKTQRTFIVNKYLEEHNAEQDKLDDWSIKDLNKYAQIYGYSFLEHLAKNKLDKADMLKIEKYLDDFAEYKANIYNMNIEAKWRKQKEKIKFNPKSPTQIRQLMAYLGIKSEGKTKKEAEQWNRQQLEVLAEKLQIAIELAEDIENETETKNTNPIKDKTHES